MLKINTAKLISDYHILDAKKHDNLVVIEKDATAYAVAHGYSEAQTAELVACVTKLQNGGLTAEESTKLEILGSYIEEVAEEEVADETTAEIPIATANGVVNNI